MDKLLSIVPFVITVWGGHAHVARHVDYGDGGYKYEWASNWELIELLAFDAVAQINNNNNQFIYICPADLAAKGVWNDDPAADQPV